MYEEDLYPTDSINKTSHQTDTVMCFVSFKEIKRLSLEPGPIRVESVDI